MGAEQVIPGAQFHRLTVIKRLATEKDGMRIKRRVVCSCECGNTTVPLLDNLVRGITKSCGCLNREKRIARGGRAGTHRGKVIKGTVYGRLTVIKKIRKNGLLTGKVKCQCSCNTICYSYIDGLVYGMTKSCGCLANEARARNSRAHAKFGCFSAKYPKTFQSWGSMKARCYNKNQLLYESYGAKGVVVCQFLLEHPQNLVRTIGIRKKSKPSLDRFPIHNGNYTCGQCKECKRNGWKLNIRWTTRKGQSENRGDFNVRLTFDGITLIKSQWAEKTGLSAELLRRRLKRGWSVEKTLTTPDMKGNCYKPSMKF